MDYPAHVAAFLDDMLLRPVWVQLWSLWMAAALAIAPLPLLLRRETRPDGLAAAAAALALAVAMPFWRAETGGYTRIVGLPHFAAWIPLLVWFYGRRRTLASTASTRVAVAILVATISVSLAFDAVDAIRYALGERDPLGG